MTARAGGVRDAAVTAARDSRTIRTRARILDSAEHLIAVRGVRAVSLREIAAAAGQGNNTAVAYHFGGLEALVRAVVARRSQPMETLREAALAGLAPDPSLHEWVACLTGPTAAHIGGLRAPTWFLRFAEQVSSDPALHDVLRDVAEVSGAIARVVGGVRGALRGLPADVVDQRLRMADLLSVQWYADRERALTGSGTAEDWRRAGDELTDALTGLLGAPASPRR